MSELSRLLRLDAITSNPAARVIETNQVERAALARRFGLVELDCLTATLTVQRIGTGIAANGRVTAAGAQTCVISGQPVAFVVDEPLSLRFESAAPVGDEIELTDTDLDILPLEGDHLDLGEAAAQALGLALDPYPKASEAELAEYRRLLVSEEDAARAANPFAVLGDHQA